MTPKLASMAKGVVVRLAGDDRRRLSETLKGSLPWMTKSTVPSGRGRSGH
jgi:hypothetical protein